MAKYSTGIATKERILLSCKDLFYRKGYIDTTFKNICKDAQVHPGSIGHHFNGKKDIAAQIYNEIMTYFCKRVPQLFPDEDELVMLILQLALHQRLFFNDKLYRRFSIEFESEYFSFSDISDYKSYFPNIYSYVIKKISPKKADFYFAAYTSMDKGLELYIDMNIDTFTFEDVVTYTNEIYYSFLPKNELNKNVKQALELMKIVEINNEGFAISVDIKK